LAFDGTAIFGGPRSKRYALVLEDGKVKSIHEEPDNTGLDGMLFSLCRVTEIVLTSPSLCCREGSWVINDEPFVSRCDMAVEWRK